MERESMDFDVVIVGAGPAGLSAACKLAQLSQDNEQNLSICLVEKGAEIGAHILSGAVIETKALDELYPDWAQLNAPLKTSVCEDSLFYLTSEHNHIKVPSICTPSTLHNDSNNYVVSLGQLCQWLGEQAEQLGVEIFPAFPASQICYDDSGKVTGIITADMGLDRSAKPKPTYQAGVQLNAKYTLFAEGARGHMGKELIRHFDLDADSLPQHYALGIKEVWQLDASAPHYQAGKVIHSTGWPLSESDSTGGGFLYHMGDHKVAVGLITDLSYSNPNVSPFEEFQRLKHHPVFSQQLQGAERIAYGARAIAKGGLFSLPKQQFPGGLLIGCDAGTLNSAKIKGTHTAMKSGLIAAEAVFNAMLNSTTEPDYESVFKSSWLYQELDQSRNFIGAVHRFGPVIGGAISLFEHNLWLKMTTKRSIWDIKHKQPDHLALQTCEASKPIAYPKPDGVLSFDKNSSVYLSGTHHEEDQPCHLIVSDRSLPTGRHLTQFNEPSVRYCPAGVYELIEVDGQTQLQINAANCLHCKTCDIKDPSQNILWRPPEGGGPSYSSM
ncbi:electron transfer flavoprotein-ubiquinone oxidoreductase [Vibrio aquaticus]|uniref:Electron transfer flavoprotein-ubiquinone oxidoreductase n=1 Tax=Vibrio aquaticus TaxID=2496559 RepID=A0A432D0Y5_9VIBR|nr:electron transfer flavoprotein-ubiquinone oxidoreductase [Vibrio aquaticus]RTZ17535.1 electron transfer flavoprotein-ubiquinone oxidoreductase [Vibrio aquaticus]